MSVLFQTSNYSFPNTMWRDHWWHSEVSRVWQILVAYDMTKIHKRVVLKMYYCCIKRHGETFWKQTYKSTNQLNYCILFHVKFYLVGVYKNQWGVIQYSHHCYSLMLLLYFCAIMCQVIQLLICKEICYWTKDINEKCSFLLATKSDTGDL